VPHVIVIAGPNGAGKSTTAPAILKGALGVTEFVNADTIAQGLSAFNPEKAAFHAGRVMLERLQQLSDDHENFAFETTLASKTIAPWLKRLKTDGYAFHLFFLWLPSPEFAVARVAERVRMGGHHVPDDTVRRRYRSGLDNFFIRYMLIADTWHVFDNSRESDPQLIATHDRETGIFINNQLLWEQIRGEY
jgi:predicted ABC-type ATPase